MNKYQFALPGNVYYPDPEHIPDMKYFDPVADKQHDNMIPSMIYLTLSSPFVFLC